MAGLEQVQAPPLEGVFTRLEFRDCLDYARMLGERYGIEAEAFQVEPGHCRTWFDAFDLSPGELKLAHTRIELSQTIEFRVPREFTLVSISPNQESYVCNGVQVSGAMLTLYPGGQVYSGTYPENWDAFDILISHTLIHEHELLRKFLRPGADSDSPLVAQDCGALGSAWLDRIAQLFQQAEVADNPASLYLLALEASGLVVGGLNSLLEKEFFPADASRFQETRRPDLVNEARAFIESNPDRDLSAEILAAELKVTYRLLHYAFTDSLQISPYQYLMIKRLHDIRETLKSTDLSIRDACYAHGFYTLSRFRRQYVRLFGELPSETRATAHA